MAAESFVAEVREQPDALLRLVERRAEVEAVVEEAPAEELIQRPKHPYTQLLLSAVPDPRAALGISDAADVGEPPKVIDPRPGCRFRARCPYAIARCETETPELRAIGPRRRVACHVAEPDA